MLNKVFKLFVLLITLQGIVSCSKTHIVTMSDATTYNKDKQNLVNNYSVSAPLNLEDWHFLYQNKFNTLANYSYSNNYSNFQRPHIINLVHKYRDINQIVPNFVVDHNILYLINNDVLITVDLTINKIINQVKIASLNGAQVIGLAFNEDYLYITTNIGKVFAFYKDGEESWSLDLMYPLQSAAIIDNDKLFVIANNSIYAINLISGDILWTYNGIISGITLNQAISPTVYENFIVVGLSNGTVVVLRKENGQLIWNYTISKRKYSISNAIIAPPFMLANGTNILIGSLNGSMVLLNTLNNTSVWYNNQIGYITPPVVINNHAFILDTTSYLHNIDLSDGNPYWSLDLTQVNKKFTFMNWFGPFLVNDNLLIYNHKGDFYIISPNSGDIIAQYRLDLDYLDHLTHNIAFIQNKIIVLGNKKLYIVE